MSCEGYGELSVQPRHGLLNEQLNNDEPMNHARLSFGVSSSDQMQSKVGPKWSQ